MFIDTKSGTLFKTKYKVNSSCWIFTSYLLITFSEGDSIADAQPPPKRINTEASASSTTNSGMINGLEVS